MKKRLAKFLSLLFILILAIGFVAKFGLPGILKAYIQAGVGSCSNIPVLCMAPEPEEINFTVDKSYIQEFIPYHFPKLEIYLPRGFKVVQELIKKPYYKKRIPRAEPVIYLLHQGPDYFVTLFPQVKKINIDSNYLFLREIMSARESQLANLNAAFFLIMKGIFIPDLGDQRQAKMIRFRQEDKTGFINYNLSPSTNYFDCNVIDKEGDFFKIYIRDTRRELDLDKVIAIISTLSGAK